MLKIKVLSILIFNFLACNNSFAADLETNSGSLMLGIIKFIFYIVLFIIVIFLSLYGTKYIAKNYNKLTNSKYIENIDSMSLSNGSYVNLLKIDKYIYIVLHGEGKAVILDKILEDDFQYIKSEGQDYLNRDDVMSKIINFRNKGK